VDLRQRVGDPARGFEAKHLTQQRRVLVPVAARIQRGDETVARRELRQRRPARAPSRQLVGEPSTDPVDLAGAQEKIERLRWLVREHLAHQVAAHAAVVTGEALHESARVLCALQRDRREPHSRRPSAGALEQQVQFALVQLDACPLAQRTSLVPREGEIGGAYLRHAARQAKSLQAQRRIDAGREDQAQR
jgi:hypothetical protein